MGSSNLNPITSVENYSLDQEPKVTIETKSEKVARKTIKSLDFWSFFLGLNANTPARICNKMSLLKKNIKYRISLIYTMSLNYFFPKKQPWFSEISDKDKNISNIYLGGIPLKNKGHIDMFNNLGITSILSLLEDFEYQETYISKPVKTEDWNDKNIKQYKIKALDFEPLSIDEINEGVKFLKDEIESNNKVYVHCKAGKGRSVTIVCCYLIAEKNMTAKEALEFVKSKRCNINLNKHQKKRIEEFEKTIKVS